MKHLLAVLLFAVSMGFSQTSSLYPNFDFELGNLNNWKFYSAMRPFSATHTLTSITSCTVPSTSTNSACGCYVFDSVLTKTITCSVSAITPVPGRYMARIKVNAQLATIAVYEFTVNGLAPVINLQYDHSLNGGTESYSDQPFNQIVIRDVATNAIIAGSLEDFCVSTNSSTSIPLSPPGSYCTGWMTYTRNLSPYIGTPLKIEIITTTCVFTGHENQSFFDGYFTTTTGIKEKDLYKNIQIFPNPATDNITIKKPFDQELKYSIYDVQGKLVKEETSDEINISELQKGFYILRAIGKDQTYNQSFIKD